MKALFPKQRTAADFFIDVLGQGKSTMDTSSVGTGKTVVASYIAKTLLSKKEYYPNPHFSEPFTKGVKPPKITKIKNIFTNVAVICPKAVIPAWERELEEFGVTPLFVINYEKIRTGNTKFLSKKGKKIMKWELPENTLILMDEIHKAKGPYTQNAQLLISLICQGFQVHGMSATACEDPTEMRAIGYMLGLHSLNKSEGGKRSWYSWMLSNGCMQDQWKTWKIMSRKKLKPLREKLYSETTYKLTIEDFPDSFRNNRVFVEPIEFSAPQKIIKAYDDLGITPDIVEEFIDKGTVEDSDFNIVNIIKARMLAESYKVLDLVDMAKDYVSQGYSVVVFLNYKDSIDAFCAKIDCGSIEGGQTTSERQLVVDQFQNDKTRVLAVNIMAGGTGLSLHDTQGKHPRVSLISPSFSAKNHLQVLGRIHRNGAKSDALQKILVAADSVEEKVMQSIEKKIKNLKTLHG